MERTPPKSGIPTRLENENEAMPFDLASAEYVIGNLMSKLPDDREVFAQLQKLAAYIANARAEVSAMRAGEVKQDFIPNATDELDAIVEATAAATNRIMDAADVIMEMATRVGAQEGEKATAAATSIYEPCTFQDITGQRVSKVVNALRVIESRIDKMMAAPGEIEDSAGGGAAAAAAAPVSSSQADIDSLFSSDDLAARQKVADAHLLNGPARPVQAPSQDNIDAMFSGKG